MQKNKMIWGGAKTMIEVKNISLALNKRQILNNVSLTLKEGTI